MSGRKTTAGPVRRNVNSLLPSATAAREHVKFDMLVALAASSPVPCNCMAEVKNDWLAPTPKSSLFTMHLNDSEFRVRQIATAAGSGYAQARPGEPAELVAAGLAQPWEASRR